MIMATAMTVKFTLRNVTVMPIRKSTAVSRSTFRFVLLTAGSGTLVRRPPEAVESGTDSFGEPSYGCSIAGRVQDVDRSVAAIFRLRAIGGRLAQWGRIRWFGEDFRQ